MLPPLVLAARCARVAAVPPLQGIQAGGSRGASCVHRDSRGRGYRIWPQVTGGYLVMLMSPLGVGLAVAGAVIWIVDDRSAPTLLVVGLLLTSALVYGESVRDRSTMPMLLRRFVPVILPLSVLCIGMLIDRAWRHSTMSRVLAIAAWAALLPSG